MKISKIAILRQWLFPSQSITLCLEAIGWCDGLFGDETAWYEVRDALVSEFYQTTPKRDAFVTDDGSAARFVLAVIADYAEREVSTGKFHIYRGVLSDRGVSLQNIAELALTELREGHWLSYDEHLERQATLAEKIKLAG